MKALQSTRLGMMIALFIATASCVGQTVKFDGLAEQKYDITKPKDVTASACGFQLLLLIPINTNSRAHRAYDNLIREAGPSYVVRDVKVQETWYYAAVGTVYCTEFEAIAYPKIIASTGSESQGSEPSVPDEPSAPPDSSAPVEPPVPTEPSAP